MIYSLSGKLMGKKDNFVILEAGGIGFKVYLSNRAAQSLAQIGSSIKLYCSLHARENEPFELFGFVAEEELYLFDRLNTVSGIGPKTALAILGVSPIDQLVAAINEGKTDLLTRAGGVGKKTAERIILDLKGKLTAQSGAKTKETLSLMESDLEIEDTLMSLGYNRQQAKNAISKIDDKTEGFKERLKEALKKAKA